MSDQRDIAMQRAVDLALSGRCSNWWTIQARMRISGWSAAHLGWTDVQRDWLDRLCAEARLAASAAGGFAVWSSDADQDRRGNS
jgi:hypothetical protein